MNITRYRSTLLAAAVTGLENRLTTSSGNTTALKTNGADSHGVMPGTWIATKVKGINSSALTLYGQRKQFP